MDPPLRVSTEMTVRPTSVSFRLAAAAVFSLVWPIYSGFDGRRTTHATLLEVNGGTCPSVIFKTRMYSRRAADYSILAIVTA
jgi:hypothetical protein